MTARHSTSTSLPPPSAARFGRSRTPWQDNIGFRPRQTGHNSAGAQTSTTTQHPAKPSSVPDQSLHSILTRSLVGASRQAAPPQSP
jgi:hypothetical protein